MARVEGKLPAIRFKSTAWESDSLDPRNLRKGLDYKNLAGLLRICNTKHRDERIGYFWPSELLSLIMTEKRVAEALAHECRGLELDYDNRQIAIPIIRKDYLKIFAILLLLSRGADIKTFLNYQVRDEDLPLEKKVELGEPALYRRLDLSNTGWDRGGAFGTLECFEDCKWLPHEIEFFSETQWRLCVPYFASPGDYGKVKHYSFRTQTILPWCPSDIKSELDMVSGGFASVERVKIDPCSHGFSGFLGRLSLASGPLFAIKTLRSVADFESETEMMKNLAHTPHPHLINLLATFNIGDNWSLILPLATCDLYTFWEIHDGPLMTSVSKAPTADLLWVATQITGLVSALTVIHNVGPAYSPGRPYGRHGDIKSDNILCFPSPINSLGTLVLSDFGLSSSHKQNTDKREKTGEKTVAFTPAYRPPESDIESRLQGASRRSDIWSFGCLLLEMACWILGGKDALINFHSIRTVVSAATGAASSVYFEVNKLEDTTHEFRVKKEVIEYIATLHRHSNCTQFVHDLLDIVQTNMLIVNPAQRSMADDLLMALEHCEEQAKENKEYLVEHRPITRIAPMQSSESTIRGLLNPDTVRLDRDHEYNKARMSAKFSRASYRPLQRSVRLKEIPASPEILVTQFTQFTPEAPRSVRKYFPDRTPRPISEMSGARQCPDMLDYVLQNVMNSYSRIAGAPADDIDVTIEISWQLQQCIQDELEGNLDLSSVLTITGNEAHSWASPCFEYVQAIWTSFGVRVIEKLMMCLDQHMSPNQPEPKLPLLIPLLDDSLEGITCTFPPAAKEGTEPSILRFRGTSKEATMLCQCLSWFAATFRMPNKDELSCSSVEFESETSRKDGIRFRISLEKLSPMLDQDPGTCWKPLFPSTIVATGFPTLHVPGSWGLQIPFGAMLEMADILCDVNLEDEEGNFAGVYFDSAKFVLYATHYFKENAVQWHLRRKSREKEQNQALRPDHGSKLTWARELRIETLSEARAILGYCGEVQIQLGTVSRLEHFKEYEYCLASSETPPPELSLSGLTASLGFKGATVGATGTFRMRTGLKIGREEIKDRDYTEVLDDAETEHAILFETSPGQERAWMVPQLSLILELFNFWAFKKGFHNLMRFATAGPNDGSNARAVLDDDDFIVLEALKKRIPSDKGLCVGDIIKRIHNRIELRTVENSKGKEGTRGTIKLGASGILGWDWLELAGAPSLSDRRSITKFPETCWMHFTQSLNVPVFMGQNLGQVIRPVNVGELCKHWYPMPGGAEKSYLVVSIASIRKLSRKSGKKGDWYFQDDFVWDIQGKLLFRPCAKCLANPSVCSKHPQTLHKHQKKLVKKSVIRDMVRTIPQLEEKGAVVFASGRKDERALPRSNG